MTPDYILAEKYRLIALIGRGGMGSVWRAEHLAWHSPVAVKLMDRATEASPEVMARFQSEARLAANLRSPHVVQILDEGRDAASGAPFIVMELLVGESLAQRISRVERLSAVETARIITHVARALSLAHELPMVHRDLKPDNIFLVRNDDEEIAKVLDFGIAKWNAESFVDAPTATGSVMGTPFYMSPEQISDSKRVDHRSDLWSLGVIAYECLTGRRAFQASSLLGLALAICSGRPPVPSSIARVPDGFDAWFERATAHQLSNRFQSARELADELRRICGGSASAPLSEGAGREGVVTSAAPPGLSPLSSVAPTATFHGLEAHPKSMVAVSQTTSIRPARAMDRRVKLAAIAGGLAVLLLGPYLLLRSSPPAAPSAPAASAPSAPLPPPAQPLPAQPPPAQPPPAQPPPDPAILPEKGDSLPNEASPSKAPEPPTESVVAAEPASSSDGAGGGSGATRAASPGVPAAKAQSRKPAPATKAKVKTFPSVLDKDPPTRAR